MENIITQNSSIPYFTRQRELCRPMQLTERKQVVTTDKDGATAEEFAEYLLETLKPML